MPRVNVPGVGFVNFPDSMSAQDISAAIERDLAPANELPRFVGGYDLRGIEPPWMAESRQVSARVDKMREPDTVDAQGRTVAGGSKTLTPNQQNTADALDALGGGVRGAATLGGLALDVGRAVSNPLRALGETATGAGPLPTTQAAEAWGNRRTRESQLSAGLDAGALDLQEGRSEAFRLGGEVLLDPTAAIGATRAAKKVASKADDIIAFYSRKIAETADPAARQALEVEMRRAVSGVAPQAPTAPGGVAAGPKGVQSAAVATREALPQPTDDFVGQAIKAAGEGPEVAPVATQAPPPQAVGRVAEKAAQPKLDPIARKQVAQYVKKNNITDRGVKDDLFRNGLTPEQKVEIIKKPLPPVKEVGMSRFTTTAPDKMREDLGASGFEAWRMLDERNFLHETRQIRDEKVVKSVTKGWSEQDHIDAFDYLQRARYPMDPAREAAMRPEVRAGAEKVATLLKRQADDLTAAGVKVPVEAETGRQMMEFVPIEEGYAPWYRRGDVDAPGLPQGRFRRPDASRSRVMARDEAIPAEELDRHLGRAALRYFDETNELVATAKVFGNEPSKAIDQVAEKAIAEGKDGFYIREALDLALNGGPTKSNFERNLVQKLSQITVNLTLPFSGPAQLSQISMAATKGGVVNLMRGMGRAIKSITDAGLRDEIVKSGATFESVSKGLHEGRSAQGFLGKTSAATLNSPIGVTPWDKFARYLSGAMGRPYADDLARVVRGEKVAWYDDLKLSPEVAARELAAAGVDAKKVAAGQPLSPDDYDRVTRRFALDSNLGQRPEDHSIIFQRSPFERLRGILLRFGMQQFPQFRREVWRPLTQQKRVGPLARWAVATPAAGYVNKKFGDLVYNRDTDDETNLDALAESYVAGAFGIYYQLALAAKYGFDGVFAGAALDKVGDVMDAAGQYGWGIQEGAREAINEGDPGYLTDALRKPVDDAMEGKGPLIRVAKIHPVVNAAMRHLEDPDRSPFVP